MRSRQQAAQRRCLRTESLPSLCCHRQRRPRGRVGHREACNAGYRARINSRKAAIQRLDHKRRRSMANPIEAIPEKTRWEIAAKGLTGAYIAISNALKEALGQKKFEEFNGSLWYGGRKGSEGICCHTLGLAAEDAGDVEGVTHLLAQASMGPEFVFEVVESTKDRCVGKTTQCPWHKRWKEQGVDFDTCGVGHQRWGDGAVESLNPNFTFRLPRICSMATRIASGSLSGRSRRNKERCSALAIVVDTPRCCSLSLAGGDITRQRPLTGTFSGDTDRLLMAGHGSSSDSTE